MGNLLKIEKCYIFLTKIDSELIYLHQFWL